MKLATLSPNQLRICAAGYSDALAECALDAAGLRQYVPEVAGRSARLEADNDHLLYHQAYRH